MVSLMLMALIIVIFGDPEPDMKRQRSDANMKRLAEDSIFWHGGPLLGDLRSGEGHLGNCFYMTPQRGAAMYGVTE